MKNFIKTLFASVAFLIVSCVKYTNDPLWNKVVNHFTNPSVTKEQIFNQMSTDAIGSIIGGYPVVDSAQQLVAFFKEYENDHNYIVERQSDTVSVTFNPQYEIAGGPLIYIYTKDTSWKVIEVIFGK